MECHRRVFCNDRLAPTKKDAFINIAILITIARGYHQALRVLLDQAGAAWKDITILSETVSIAQFDTTPMNLAVLSGCVPIVQVLLDQVQQVQGQSLSAIPGFLLNAMMHERLDIVLHLVKQAKAFVNGGGDVDRDLHCLLIKAIPDTLLTAIERRSRSVVKLIFEEFKRGELLLDDLEDGELDKFVQDSKSLPILRGFILWCLIMSRTSLRPSPTWLRCGRKGTGVFLRPRASWKIGVISQRGLIPRMNFSWASACGRAACSLFACTFTSLSKTRSAAYRSCNVGSWAFSLSFPPNNK